MSPHHPRASQEQQVAQNARGPQYPPRTHDLNTPHGAHDPRVSHRTNDPGHPHGSPLAIEASALRKSFGRAPVLDGLDFAVRRGEIFAMLGPNGAGKTTTINILTTLASPDGGSARVAGYDVTRSPEEVKRRISLTGQAAAVDDALTGTENLRMFARLAGLGRPAAEDRAAELLDRFDLRQAAARRVRTYSGGMRRRLDLALSFVFTPEILFLDEPTTGLDTRSRRDLWEVIRVLARSGTTVFLTTQYLEEADQLADRVAVLNGGRIAGVGTASELKARMGGDTVQLHDEQGTLIREVSTDGSVSGLRSALDLLDEDGATGTVSLRRPTLDDVFLSLTGEAGVVDRGNPADRAGSAGVANSLSRAGRPDSTDRAERGTGPASAPAPPASPETPTSLASPKEHAR